MNAVKVTAGVGLAVLLISGLWFTRAAKADFGRSGHPPRFVVDASWPKPLPSDAAGHQWVTGEVGGSCITADDHIVTVNRGFQGGLVGQDGTTSVAAPPVVEYDADGNVVRAWGDPSRNADGTSVVMPTGIHGCFVDYQDNVWIAGNGDGVVQKWTRDGRTKLLQIGTKDVCDWPANGYKCGNSAADPSANQSHTLLNEPADIAIDANPDPQTGQRGSVYVADGYGNHRIVVFDAAGNWVRQWGSAGDGPGQFGAPDGGHPHCVVLGHDGLVYTCDRNNSRIEVFDKLGNFQRAIPIDIPKTLMPLGNLGTLRACDITLSPDRAQNWMYDTDLGNDSVWILDRAAGAVVARIGRAGHNAGEFAFAHTVDVDSTGRVMYVAETITGRRIQKFVALGNPDED
jgi:hypothetical protein